MDLFEFVERHYKENKCEISLTKFTESSVNNRGRALNEIKNDVVYDIISDK